MTARARLDADRTAEPLTRIEHHPPHGGCIGPYMPLVNPEYVDENGKRTPLSAPVGEAPFAFSADERAGILRCLEWLKTRAVEIESDIDGDCDGADADRLCDEASVVRTAARDMAKAFGVEWKR